MAHPRPRAPFVSGPQLIEGEWSTNNGGYTLKLGDLFAGHIEQRGGDSIYKESWIISLNGQHVGGGGSDRLFAERFAEHLILTELKRLTPVFRRLRDRAPPYECFWGQDSHARWGEWKAERGLPPYNIVKAK